MTPIEIRIALLRKGYTAVRLGEEIGLCRSTVSNVINGYGFSMRVAVGISDATGIPVPRLFPGRIRGAVRRRKAA